MATLLLRAWVWFRSHPWFGWIALGLVLLWEGFLRRKTPIAVAGPTKLEIGGMLEAAKAAGSAEVHEAAATKLDAEADAAEEKAEVPPANPKLGKETNDEIADTFGGSGL